MVVVFGFYLNDIERKSKASNEINAAAPAWALHKKCRLCGCPFSLQADTSISLENLSPLPHPYLDFLLHLPEMLPSCQCFTEQSSEMGQTPLLHVSCGVRIRRQRIKRIKEKRLLQRKKGRRMASEGKYFTLSPFREKEEGAQGGRQVLTGTYWCRNLCRDYFLSKGTGGGDRGPVWGCMGRRNLNLTFFNVRR